MDIWIEQQAKIAQFKEMSEEGKVTGMPDWVSDPGKFLETVRGVTGTGEGKGLPEWMTDPAKFIGTVETITGKGKGDETLRTELADLVVDLKRPVTGRTEIDLLHEVATEGIITIRTEAAGMRGLIKEAIVGGALPPPKSAKEWEERTEKLRQAIQTDRKIEELRRRLEVH